MLPDWLLVISLVLLLAHTTYTTLIKAKQQYDKETAAMNKASKSMLVQVVETEIEMGEQTSMLADTDIVQNEITINPEDQFALIQLMDDEAKTPFDKVMILSIMVVVTCGLNMLKGMIHNQTLSSQQFTLIRCLFCHHTLFQKVVVEHFPVQWVLYADPNHIG